MLSFPATKTFLILTLFIGWWLVSNPSLRIRSVLAAVAFFFIESVYLKLQSKANRSTFAQFWNNIWSHPLIADFYFRDLAGDWSSASRILLYPIVIWGLELLQNKVMIRVYGKNVAWDYSGSRYAKFQGVIDLSMAPEWWMLGIVMEYVYMPLAQ